MKLLSLLQASWYYSFVAVESFSNFIILVNNGKKKLGFWLKSCKTLRLEPSFEGNQDYCSVS